MCSSDLPRADAGVDPTVELRSPRFAQARHHNAHNQGGDRKSVVKGKSVDLGGRRLIKKKKNFLQLM